MGNFVKPPCDEAAILTAWAGAAPCASSTGRWVIIVAILASSMAFIDGTAVNVSLPALQSLFQANLAQVQWVVESFPLVLFPPLLTRGSLGGNSWRRSILSACVALVVAAS